MVHIHKVTGQWGAPPAPTATLHPAQSRHRVSWSPQRTAFPAAVTRHCRHITGSGQRAPAYLYLQQTFHCTCALDINNVKLEQCCPLMAGERHCLLSCPSAWEIGSPCSCLCLIICFTPHHWFFFSWSIPLLPCSRGRVSTSLPSQPHRVAATHSSVSLTDASCGLAAWQHQLWTVSWRGEAGRAGVPESESFSRGHSRQTWWGLLQCLGWFGQTVWGFHWGINIKMQWASTVAPRQVTACCISGSLPKMQGGVFLVYLKWSWKFHLEARKESLKPYRSWKNGSVNM